MNVDSEEVIGKLRSFLVKASQGIRSTERNSQCWALRAFGGDFWSNDTRSPYGKLPNGVDEANEIPHNPGPIRRLVNQGVSRYAKRPWHCQINGDEENLATTVDQFGNKMYLSKSQCQDIINSWESDNDFKYVNKRALQRAFVCGGAYVQITSDDEGIKPELIVKHDSVYVDPHSIEPDLSDAKKIAVHYTITKGEADKKYNVTEDIKLGDNETIWGFANDDSGYINCWDYYHKKGSSVVFHKIVGNQVIETRDMKMDIIPIVRFSGYEDYRSEGVMYVGMEQLTAIDQETFDLACWRAHKRLRDAVDVVFSMSGVAAKDEGTKKAMKALHQGKTNVAITPVGGEFKLESAHVPFEDIEAYRQAFYENIQRNTGIILNDFGDTATESLIQQENTDDAVSEIWENANRASRQLCRIFMQMVFGKVLPFELTNGPDSITTQKKERQQYEWLYNMTPDEAGQKVISRLAAKSLDNEELYNSMMAGQIIESNEINIGQIIAERNQAVMDAQTTAEAWKAEQDNINEIKLQNVELRNQMSSTAQQDKLAAINTQISAKTQEISFMEKSANIANKNKELQSKVIELEAKIKLLEAQAHKTEAEATEKDIQNASAEAELVVEASNEVV